MGTLPIENASHFIIIKKHIIRPKVAMAKDGWFQACVSDFIKFKRKTF
jgi:hypothetical protein